jgi:flagellar protein FlbD
MRMIRVKRINNKDLVVNAELIEFLEQTPDSVISLTTGKKFAVMDTIDEIVLKVIEYRLRINEPLRIMMRHGGSFNDDPMPHTQAGGQD